MFKSVTKSAVIAVAAGVLLAGCASVPPPHEPLGNDSPLTQGNVQLNLVVGETTKAEVLEKFGAPNITTRDGSGREVWSYQRAAQVSRSSSRSGGWSILFVGQSGSSGGFESGSRMVTLIIKFDSNDVVADFKSRTSTF